MACSPRRLCEPVPLMRSLASLLLFRRISLLPALISCTEQLVIAFERTAIRRTFLLVNRLLGRPQRRLASTAGLLVVWASMSDAADASKAAWAPSGFRPLTSAPWEQKDVTISEVIEAI